MEPKWPERWTDEIGEILGTRASGMTDWDRAQREAPARHRRRQRTRALWLGVGLAAASLAPFLGSALVHLPSDRSGNGAFQAAEALILDEEGHWEEVDGIFALTASLIASGK